jgi:hypothetical protein
MQSNNYRDGCYDSECEGFVTIPGATGPRSRLYGVSIYGGQQFETRISVEHVRNVYFYVLN